MHQLFGGPQWPGQNRRQRARVNRESRGQSSSRRSEPVSKRGTTPRTTCARATGEDNIISADDDDDFMPSPSARFCPPPDVIEEEEFTCSPSPPPSPEPQWTFIWDQRWNEHKERRRRRK